VAATSFLHRGADIQTRSTCISHEDKCWEGKTLDAMRKEEDGAAEEETNE
jgi:hypothetical protein